MSLEAKRPGPTAVSQRRSEPGDIPHHIALSTTVYSDSNTTDAAHLHWKFLGPPGNSCWSTALISDGRMVGRSMRMDRQFALSHDETALRGATISDLILDPGFRRADMMIRLVRAGSDLSDLDLILHGSNESSLPIYQKLFKYPVAFSLSARAFPLRASRALKKLFGVEARPVDLLTIPWRGLIRLCGSTAGALGGITLKPGKLSTVEFETIYEGFRSLAGPHFIRTAQFARWRFEEGPLFNARVLRVEKKGDLIGYVALRDVEFEGLNLTVIIDVALSKRLNQLERRGLSLRIAACGGPKADAIMMLGNFENDVLKETLGFPFIGISDSLLPHPNPMFALFKDKKDERISRLKTTFMTLADLDYF